MKIRKAHHVALLTVIALLTPAARAFAGVADIAISPPYPSTIDEVTATVSGTFTDTCVPSDPVTTVGNGSITIATSNTSPSCSAVATAYALAPQSLGTLGAGQWCVTVTYESLLSPAAPIGEQCFTVANILKYSGRAKNVEDDPGPGQVGSASVKVKGLFSVGTTPMDLSTATVTLTQILEEASVELVTGTDGVDLVPWTLGPRPRSKPTKVVFENLYDTRPTARFKLGQKSEGDWGFSLRISRATILENAEACDLGEPTVDLATSFEIGLASGETVAVGTTHTWDCGSGEFKAQKQKGASSGTGGGGISGNRCPDTPASEPVTGDRPSAVVVSELLSRNEGAPDLVEFDGSRSSDPDGTIEDYTLTVFDKATCATVYGPETSAAAKSNVLFDSGEYVASLIVTDDDGNTSEAYQRGFSVR